MDLSAQGCSAGPAYVLTLLLVAATATAATPSEPLQFRITEGRVLNAFHRQGPVAAHLLLSDGEQPRVLVAFPAGNSGAGIWFQDAQRPVRWTLHDITSISRMDARGRTLRGIDASVSVDGTLVVRDAVLSSVRVLRDYQLLRTYPTEIRSLPKITERTVEWARPRLDDHAGYAITVALENGHVRRTDNSTLRLSPIQSGEPLRLRIMALTGETPLTPLGADRLLNAAAINDPRSRQVLDFLSYEEKFLAGSWRFDTYFGRDTLMSLRLLMPALQPEAIERGLMSVLERLAANGEVAHEEDIGEFAVLRHRRQGETSAAPIYDYNMIDDDFMLAAVASAYLFDTAQGRSRARAFLAARLPSGERVGTALARNLSWVIQTARPFADDPEPAKLVSLKEGLHAGQWRDSQDGLGAGRYPYDVNAVFVPAALTAIAKLADAGLLEPYSTADQRKALADATKFSRVWQREAPLLFKVRIANAKVRRQIASYAAEIAVDARPALDALGENPLVVNAIALDRTFEPIDVMHSDGGFALLLQDLPAAQVEELVDTMMRPFPAGLLTDAGLLVANPVFANEARRQHLGRTAYHGTVIWSWQQAVLAAGLDRQIARSDLPPDTLDRLRKARKQLWVAIENARELRASELWSWRFENGSYHPAPFGQTSGDVDESNAAQLWSTVYLAIAPPPR